MSKRFIDPIEWEDTLPIRPSSLAWRAVVKAIYGSPLTDEEHALFLQLSGGREPPVGGAVEVEGVIGRRGGKSETNARVAVFECTQVQHAIALAERIPAHTQARPSRPSMRVSGRAARRRSAARRRDGAQPRSVAPKAAPTALTTLAWRASTSASVSVRASCARACAFGSR